MRIETPIVMAALAVVFAGCAGAAAQQPRTELATAGQCSGLDDIDQQVAELYANKISKVEPIHRTQFVARAIQPRYVAGAQLTVPAERGMTAAYLERTLSCHAAARTDAAHPNDPLRVEGVEDIDVEARGPSFRIAVTGLDRAAGKAIWQRARALEAQNTQVEVEQVASTAAVQPTL